MAVSAEAAEKLRTAVAKRKQAEDAVVAARAEERATIAEILAEEGVLQADVVRITGYTRETIRRVAEAAERRTREAG